MGDMKIGDKVKIRICPENYKYYTDNSRLALDGKTGVISAEKYFKFSVLLDIPAKWWTYQTPCDYFLFAQEDMELL